jgi:predicted RND superfamily exporter protein
MADWYTRCLRYPGILLAASLLLATAFIYQIRYFDFDASADTLVVQGDPELARYLDMAEQFGGDDFIVLTYASPDIFTPQGLEEIQRLQAQVSSLAGVSSTYSILDAPLIESPPIPLDHLAEDYRTLRKDDVDLVLARRELTHSPLLSNYLIAEDGETTAISATLRPDLALEKLRKLRDQYRLENHTDLGETEEAYRLRRLEYVAQREDLINKLREIRDGYQGNASLFISGVPMIAADMLAYVRSDLMIFGTLVVVLIVALLYAFFRKLRWVMIPLATCSVTVAVSMGLLGVLRTPVTVVSSNFIALLAIISISFSIHLIVRYRELLQETQLAHFDLVRETMKSKFAPCLYTALTTMLAFGSMMSSRIVPIEDFGWMMCAGITIALIVTYTVFPAILLLIGAAPASATINRRIRLTEWFRFLSVEQTRWVVIASLILLVPGLFGLSLVSFDNRFIDYFADDTDIHQGMVQIDRHLGGTLPLDIYVRFETFEQNDSDFFEDAAEDYPERYWFTPDKLETLQRLEDHLQARPEIGKIISLASMEQMARRFNEDNALAGIEIAYVLGELPPDVRAFMIEPYALPEAGWMRLNARIRESVSEFSKDALIRDIRQFAIEDTRIRNDDLIVTGMVVLFNDMLQQLADSQAKTLGYVIGATFIMFALLLRSIPLAAIAILPNALAAMLIISVMGYAGIDMNMMTVTIAAICIGIGVDDAIHYTHRFRVEFDQSGDARQSVIRAHETIGRAMYFTTMTVIAGFSILAFSNFVPTVHFGLLTALAMALALTANMVLLPALILLYLRSGRMHF